MGRRTDYDGDEEESPRQKYHNVSGRNLRELRNEGTISQDDYERAIWGVTDPFSPDKVWDNSKWGTTAPPRMVEMSRGRDEGGPDKHNVGGPDYVDINGKSFKRLGRKDYYYDGKGGKANYHNADWLTQHITFDPTYGFVIPADVARKAQYIDQSDPWSFAPLLFGAALGGIAGLHSAAGGAAAAGGGGGSAFSSALDPITGVFQGTGGLGGSLASAPSSFSLGASTPTAVSSAAGGAGGPTGFGSLEGLADFSLAGSGAGIGGQGTAYTSLGTLGNTIGMTPAMVAAGGGPAAFGAMNALGGAATLGTGGSSLWDNFTKLLFGDKGAAGAASSVLGQAGSAAGGLGGLLGFGNSIWEAIQTKNNNKEFMNLMKDAINRSDPFGSQRGFYQDQLRQSYTDPNFFSNNPVFKGIRDIAINDTGREMAAMGYNGSGNMLHEIASRINKEGMNYALNFQNQTGNLAGAQFSPVGAGSLAAGAATQNMNNQQQANGAWGNVLKQLPNVLSTIGGLL